MVGEFAGIALSGDELCDCRAVRLRRIAECVVVAIERPGQHGRAGVRLFGGVHGAAELRRHDLGAGDPLRRPARQRDRRFVGRMDCAVKIGRLQSRLVDPPEDPLRVDEVVRAPGPGRGQSRDTAQILAVADRRPSGGGGRRETQEKSKSAKGENRPHRLPTHSFRSATSSMRWLAPFVNKRSARGRVGRIFSCRLTRLILRQIERAVASASSSSRSAYWRK